jgi:hypothetical protein
MTAAGPQSSRHRCHGQVALAAEYAAAGKRFQALSAECRLKTGVKNADYRLSRSSAPYNLPACNPQFAHRGIVRMRATFLWCFSL